MPTDTKALQKAFGKNLDLYLFYVTWLKNELNAGKAYKELHPSVDEHSARTLGSKLLTKIDKELVMQAYGLDTDKYFTQLREGLNANKWNDFTGEREPDHKTRLPYHNKLGKQLGIETDTPNLTQVNMTLNVVPDDDQSTQASV